MPRARGRRGAPAMTKGVQGVNRLIGVSLALAALGVLLLATTGGPASSNRGNHILRDAVTGQLKPATLTTTSPSGTSTTRTLPFFSDASLAAAEDELCNEDAIPNCDERMEAADGSGDVQVDGSASGGQTSTGGGPAHSLGCGGRTSNGNKRVNQDCTYRRQAEEEQVYNPADPNNIVGGQNDSRVGFNQCGIDFSTNNGKNYGDLLPPFRQKLNAPEEQEPE